MSKSLVSRYNVSFLPANYYSIPDPGVLISRTIKPEGIPAYQNQIDLMS